MVCKICGKQLPDDSSVCKYCGAKQRKSGSGEKSAPARRYSKKGMARRRMINTVLLGVIALLIVGIIAGIVVSMRTVGKNDDQDAQLSSENQETVENIGEEAVDKPEVEETDESEEAEVPTDEETEDASTEEESEDSAVTEEDESTDETESTESEDSTESEESTEPEGSTETESETTQTPVVTPTGNYTASISKTETVASLNHYRILTVSINQTLPAGVEVASVSFTSSNTAVVRTEVVDGEGRAWGVSLGEATVTGTVTLSTGETASASCVVTVVEYQEPEEEKEETGSTDSSGSSSSSSGSSGSSDYILPGSNSRVYSVSELDNLSAWQLRMARNEIYARHGRIFNDPELKKYFEGKDWYKGTIAAEDFKESMLNATEKQNIANIQKAEAN